MSAKEITMRQWKVQSGHEQPLVQVETSPRDPGPGEVRIRMHAASLNFRDQLLVSGRYPTSRHEPVVPLSDGAGEVLAVGSGVTAVKAGDRVTATTITNWIDGRFHPPMAAGSIGFTVDGWLAEEVVLPETALVVIPEALTYAAAATLPCAGVTAWNAVVETARIGPGDSVLALGTGGVSMFAVQIAKLVGAQAIVTSSSDDKLVRAHSHGADLGVNYRTHREWETRVRELTGGTGVDLVIENAATLRQSVQATRYGGTVAVIGMLSVLAPGASESSRPNGDLTDLLRFGVTIVPILMGNRRMLTRMVTAYARHGIEPVIDREFAFDEAPAAFRALVESNHVGKIVITSR
jgi:NADPH:quinone reductase-like Zn-dependent oxidoreductase